LTLGRFSRRAIVALALPLAALVAAALALPRLVDVNRYRPLLATQVQQATGRTATLGTIALELLPRPSLSVRPLALAESGRYPGRDALRAKALTIRLGILGLLRGRVVLSSIVLDRPTLTLIRDARGRWSFDDLLARASAASAAPRPAPGPPSGESGTLALAVDRVVIRSGRVLVYDDAAVPGTRSELTLSPIDATVSGWGSGGETRFDLRVGLGASALRSRARLEAGDHPRLEGEIDGAALRAADLARLLPWLGTARPAGLEVGGSLTIQGRATLPLDRLEAVRFKGTMRLDDLSYRDAGMRRPVRGLSGTLAIDGDRVTWNDFAVAIGASSLKGKLSVEDLAKPRVGFALASPRIDVSEILDTFLPPGPAARPAVAAPAAPEPEAAEPGLLQEIRGQGTLSVGAIRFQSFDLSEVRGTVALEQGALSLKDLRAGFYGGTLQGDAGLDMSRAIPRYRFGVRMKGVDVEPLVSAYDPGLKDLLRGKLTGRLDLTSSGAEMKPILAAAAGTGSLEVTEGVITSFSVLKQLAALLEMVGGKGIGRDTTPFDWLRASLAIASGRASTEDLELHSADLDLAARGWVGLDATMDLGVTARFSEEASRGMVARTSRLGLLADRQGRLAVHFSLEGNLAAPSFRLDTRAQLRGLQEKKKEEAKERVLEHLKDRLRKKLGQEEAPQGETPEQETPPQ